MRTMLALSVLLAACSSVGTTPSSATKGTAAFSTSPLIMEWNVENAFDGADQGTEYPEYSSNSSGWTAKTSLEKAQRMAQGLQTAGCPAIVIAAEVENQAAADQIARESHCGYTAYSGNSDQTQPIGVAILTTMHPTTVRRIPVDPRPHLRLEFAGGLVVYGVHFKSQRDGGDDLRKAAADAVLKDIQANPASRVIVAGDFNTADDILASQLTDCAAGAPPSYFYQGAWSHFDKIYSNHCGRTDRADSAKFPFLFNGDGTPCRTSMSKHAGWACYANSGYSDHLPIFMFD